MQISEGDLCGHLKEGFDQIGYLQLADHPGRNEPGTGEIYYPRVLRQAYELGYRGYVGLECRPATTELAAAAGRGPGRSVVERRIGAGLAPGDLLRLVVTRQPYERRKAGELAPLDFDPLAVDVGRFHAARGPAVRPRPLRLQA